MRVLVIGSGGRSMCWCGNSGNPGFPGIPAPNAEDGGRGGMPALFGDGSG